jgi:L-fucose isomerase-like protein
MSKCKKQRVYRCCLEQASNVINTLLHIERNERWNASVHPQLPALPCFIWSMIAVDCIDVYTVENDDYDEITIDLNYWLNYKNKLYNTSINEILQENIGTMVKVLLGEYSMDINYQAVSRDLLNLAVVSRTCYQAVSDLFPIKLYASLKHVYSLVMRENYYSYLMFDCEKEYHKDYIFPPEYTNYFNHNDYHKYRDRPVGKKLIL